MDAVSIPTGPAEHPILDYAALLRQGVAELVRLAGDLLTTSPTRGHAQKADDPAGCAGAIIGKALTSLASGKGEILVLVHGR